MRARGFVVALLTLMLTASTVEAATCFLKLSTAADLGLGPFVDSTDGVTAETGLTISQADVRLKKEGGAWAQKNDANACTHEENGYYECALNTTDTNTVGRLKIAVAESGALPVFLDCMVLAANAYDGLVAGSGVGVRADVQGWLGTAPATPTTAGVPEVDLTHIAGAAVNTASAQLGVNVVALSGDATAADNLEAALDGTGGVTISADLAGSVASCTGCSTSGGMTLMPNIALVQGSTSEIAYVVIRDSSTNLGKTGLTDASVGLKIRYCRMDEGNADCSTITPASATRGSYTSGGFVEKDATDAAGVYELGVPTAVLAAGADYVAIYISGVSGTLPTTLGIELVPTGLAAIANTIGTPAGASIAADIAAEAVKTTAVKAKTDQLGFTGANVNADIRATAAALTYNLTGNVTGNLSGTVGSVTGAVGSVTGAVGSVTGAVGSVAAGGIAAASFAAGAIDATAIAANAIGSSEIASGAITAAKFAAGAIDATAIANGAIDAATFAADAIDATAVAASGADKIGDDVIARFPANIAATLISAGGITTAGGTYRKNVASQLYAVYLVDSSGDAVTGATVTVKLSKDGAAAAAIAGTVAEIDAGDIPGWYLVSLAQADTNCDLCVFRAEAVGVVPRAFYFTTAP